MGKLRGLFRLLRKMDDVGGLAQTRWDLEV